MPVSIINSYLEILTCSQLSSAPSLSSCPRRPKWLIYLLLIIQHYTLFVYVTKTDIVYSLTILNREISNNATTQTFAFTLLSQNINVIAFLTFKSCGYCDSSANSVFLHICPIRIEFFTSIQYARLFKICINRQILIIIDNYSYRIIHHVSSTD